MSNSINNANSPFAAASAPAPETADIAITESGAALRERFDMAETLAESGAYSLYLARDRNRPGSGAAGEAGLVRLKALSRSAASDGRRVELFRLEADAAARLAHRNILKCATAETLNGVHFCVMEERPGVITLRDYLKRKGWLETDEALRIIQQVADALEYAHGLGVLHLTLEPEKILIEPDGTVLVADFGIGRDKDLMWARQERSRRCDPRYVSPEQIRCWEADQRSDLYLLGVILFEMLADRAPFEADDAASLKFRHLTRTPQPPYMFRPELSRALSQIILDLLGKKPEERPESVAAFKSLLEQCIATGMAADEQIEEPELFPEADAQGAVIEAAPSDWQQTLEEGEDAAGAFTVFDWEMPAPVPDEAAPTDGGAVVIHETFQDLSDDDLPGATADGDMEDFPQPEETAFLGSASSPDAVAAPPEETGEYAPDEPVMAGPVFLVEGRNRGKSHRLAWVALLLLFGAGLFWAMRAARFQDSAPIPVSEAVAAARSDSEPVALKPDEVSPPSDSATPAAAEAIPSQPEPTPTLAGDKSANEAKDRVAPSQGGQSEALAALEPPAPKRSAITPPSLSTIEPILAAQNNLPADDDGSALENGRPAEPPPAPEQPVKDEPPAPRVIRRSGDVLQNTAIIRARPVYPQAAREAGVKGAVTVEVTIDEGGNVIAARPISGPEPLRGAAVAAARRWKWIPARVDRNRAQVVGTITLNFRD